MVLSQKAKTKKAPFWWFQIIGWTIFTVLFLPIFSPKYFESLEAFLQISLTFAWGFTISCLLRFLYKKIPKQKLSQTKLTFLILIASAIGAFLWMVLDYSISVSIWGRTQDSIDPAAAIRTFATDLTVLLGWSLLYFSLKLLFDWKFENSRAESALDLARKAQLQTLRYQLDSHFLFNVLNTMNVLIDNDTNKAKKVVEELSDFLRYSLSKHDVITLPLEQELDAMNHYFEIQRIRFEQNLEINIDISEEAKSAMILNFLLHPLIENAVKYGMKTSPSPLKINISAFVENEYLNVNVKNSGYWVDIDEKVSREIDGTGTGLENVSKRLEKAYNLNQSFEIIKLENSVEVKVRIPFESESR